MSAFMARATPDDLTLVRVLEASVEILKTENEILNRRLAAAETWAAQAVITKRLDTLTPTSAALSPAEVMPRRSWLRRLAGWWFGVRAAD
jgi:hypothetical protein